MSLSALPEIFVTKIFCKLFQKYTEIVLTVNFICDIINIARMEVS